MNEQTEANRVVMKANTVLAIVTDLMFQSRLREQAKALGREFAVGDTPVAAVDGLGADPALVVVDLHVDGIDWQTVVVVAKERGIPVLAFGRHTEGKLLRAARDAGCDRVVPRSTLVEELPTLIEELATSSA